MAGPSGPKGILPDQDAKGGLVRMARVAMSPTQITSESVSAVDRFPPPDLAAPRMSHADITCCDRPVAMRRGNARRIEVKERECGHGTNKWGDISVCVAVGRGVELSYDYSEDIRGIMSMNMHSYQTRNTHQHEEMRDDGKTKPPVAVAIENDRGV